MNFPPKFPLRLFIARLYLQQNKLTEAANECTRVIQESPNLAAAHSLAGQVALAQDLPEVALNEFETTIRLRPHLVSAEAQAAVACYRLKRYEISMQHIENALKLSPKTIILWQRQADLFAVQGKTEAAIQIYREILQANNKQPMALNNLAENLAKSGQLNEALGWADQR